MECDICEREVDDSEIVHPILGEYSNVCGECFEDHGFWCRRCDNPFHEDQHTRNGLCETCENNEPFRHRNFDKNTTVFLCEDTGRTIRSNRTFGVEIEMLSREAKELKELSKNIHKTYGLVHDGSIRGTGTGVEVVTPPLQGAKGEQSLRETMAELNKTKVYVNDTCGIHVHLGSEGFLPPTSDTIVQVKQGKGNQAEHIQEILDNKINKISRIGIDLLERVEKEIGDRQGAINYIKKNKGKSINFLKGKIQNTHSAYGSFNMPHYHLVTVEMEKEWKEASDLRNSTDSALHKFTYSDTPTPKDVAKNAKNARDKMEVLLKKKLNKSRRDVLVIEEHDEAYQKLKTLLYLHTVFADVFLAMFPKSRREGNKYCSKLSNTFAPNDILAIQNFQELEAYWYKTSSINDTNYHKTQKYDSSRYYGFNLHSLFGKNKTIELRQHSGTLNAQKVLYWVALHQEILDKVIAGKITLQKLQKGQDIFYLEDKIEFLMKNLGLRRVLKDYVMTRIRHWEKK